MAGGLLGFLQKIPQDIGGFIGGLTQPHPQPQQQPQRPQPQPMQPQVRVAAPMATPKLSVTSGPADATPKPANFLDNAVKAVQAVYHVPVVKDVVDSVAQPVLRGGRALTNLQTTGQLGESGKQFAADVVNTGLNFVPIGKAEELIKGGGTLLSKLVEGAKTGAVVGGVGSGVSTAGAGGSAKDIAKSTAEGTVAGAALGTGGAAAIEGGKAAVNAAKPALTDAVKAVQARFSPQPVEASSHPATPAEPVATAKSGKPPVAPPPAQPKSVAQPDSRPQTPSLPTPKLSEKVSSSETIPQAKTSVKEPGTKMLSTKEFLAQTSRAPVFKKGATADTLEANLKTLQGHARANELTAQQRIGKSGYDAADQTSAHHYAEDRRSSGTTPAARGIYEHHVAPVLKASSRASGREYDPSYIPRFAQGKNSKLEMHLEGQRANASENAMRKTTMSNKSRVYHTITDPKTGERHLVAVASGKDVTGKAVTPKSVTIIHGDGTTTKLGARNAKRPDQVASFHDPALRGELNRIAKGLGAKAEKVVKIPRSPNAAGVLINGSHIKTTAASMEDTLLHEIGHRVDHKYNMQEHMFGGARPKSDMIIKNQIKKATREGRTEDVATMKRQMKMNGEMRKLADARTPNRGKPWAYARKGEEKMAIMFQAHLHSPELFKKLAPTTYKEFKSFLASRADTKPIVDIHSAKSLELGKQIVGQKQGPGEFIDKTGRKWNLGEATTKEIEAKTDTRYITHDVIGATSVAHVNEVNAANARNFLDTWKRSPDFKEHAVKTENADLSGAHKNWETVDTPYFKGYYFDPKTAKIIRDQIGASRQEHLSLPAKALSAANNFGIQLTVFNPFVHGQNLLEQAHIAIGNAPGPVKGVTGMAHLDKALSRYSTNSDTRFKMIQDYLRAGGHYETYGANRQTWLSDTIGKAKIAGVSLNKINSSSMAGMDLAIRSSLYDASIHQGMDPAAAVKNIDTFLGQKTSVDSVTHAFSQFYHYFAKTLIGSAAQQIRHPIKNAGATSNLAITLAALGAANYGLQQATGNKAAHFRNPGTIGLINDANNARKGNFGAVTSHVAPGLLAAGDQLYGKNYFTGKPLNDAGARFDDAKSILASPSTAVDKAASGKQSVLETLTNAITGISTPHAKGTEAAPNLGPNNPYNTKGAAGDTNAQYKGQQDYYKGLAAGRASLGSDQRLLGLYDSYFSRTHNDAGQSVQLSPAERIAAAKDLLGNSKLLGAVQMAETAQQNHDPMWNLPANKLATFLEYQSTPTGDPARTNLTTVNTWLKPFIGTRDSYYSSLGTTGKSVAAPGTPTYPAFDSQTTKDLATYDTLSQSQKGAFIQNHADLPKAFDAVAKYTNEMRKAEGAPELKGSPQATPQLQKFIDTYSAADKASRASIRVSDPTGYQKMIAYFDSADLATINKEGAVDIYKGSPDQTSKQNKAISSLSRDIYQNADSTYSIYPAGWMSGKTNASSGSPFGRSSGSKKLPRGSFSFKKTALGALTGKTKVKSSFKVPKEKTVKLPKAKKIKV